MTDGSIEQTRTHESINQYPEIGADEIIDTLGLTIKSDNTNKLITFLAQLSAYTENSQMNISFNAPSSSGKSFIPMETAKLFPAEDVIQIGYSSPTAFFHQHGIIDKERGGYIVDLSRKILIFLDQPHTLLLERIRPLLSHDEKEIKIQITDKSQKAGLRTKNVYLRGFPTVIFCTAGLNLDEQEATRFLLLSPEVTQEKISSAIIEKIRKDSNNAVYQDLLDADTGRNELKKRILAIKEANIKDINIGSYRLVLQLFSERVRTYKPRHQRDIGRITSLIKVFALLNFWHRKQINGALYANENDVRSAFEVWDTISESQELNLPPYVYNFYHDVIQAYFEKKNSELVGGVKAGLSRQEIMQAHFEVHGRHIPDWQLRQQILPSLESAGLIRKDQDPTDKRKELIYPTTLLTLSQTASEAQEQEDGYGN